MCFPSIAGIRHGESLPKSSKQAMLFLSPKVLGIDTEPPQTVGLYVSQGLFPTKGVFAEWPDTVHDEEYNELKEPAAGLMLHLPMVKALRTTKGTWEIFFPCFLRLGTSGPKNGRSLLKSIDLRGIAKIRANNKGGKSDCFSPPHIAVSGGSWGGGRGGKKSYPSTILFGGSWDDVGKD